MQLSSAYDEILSSVKKNFPDAKIEGLSVQEMLPEGFEIIIGYTNDKVFGPCIMAGMGGIFTEAVKDISFRTLPITMYDAESMIKELKLSNILLKGFRHIKNVVIISAGGKEIGNADLEDNIKDTAKKYGIRIIGCNCIGVFNANTKVDSMFFSYQNMRRPKSGNICLMSQSGTVGLCALDILPRLSKFASYGNRIDVDEADLLKYFSSAKDTKVISVYIEGLLKGRKFYNALKEITPDIPVVVYKAGRSERASKAAVSHTGFLAGTHNMISGILNQAKAFRVDSFEALLSASRSLSKYNRVSSNNTLMITNGAGVTIQAIDRIETKKILSLTTLSDSTIKKLRESFGNHVSLANPVDLTGTGTEADYEAVIAAACADKNVDIIMLYIVFHVSPITEAMIDIIAQYASIKPLIFCSIGADHTEYMKSLLEKKDVPAFSSVEEWVSAAEALVY